MRFSSFRYLVREGFRNLWQNRFMALASIGVLVSCLLLTGGSYLVFRNIDHFFEWVYGQNVVIAFADADATDEESAAIEEKLQTITNVESVEFISKEDLLERYSDSFPEVLLEDLREDNPLQDSYVITFEDLSKFDATIMQIQQVENIDTVEYEPDIADMLTNFRKIILAVGGWIVALLLLVSLFIIANTIKLATFYRREEIAIMKMCGATDAFIQWPFVVEGLILGLTGALLAFFAQWGIYQLVAKLIIQGNGLSLVTMVSYTSMIRYILAIFCGTGALIGVCGSLLAIRKFLQV